MCCFPFTERLRQKAKSISADNATPRQTWGEKASPGFTLVEVLMAAAILAIGLTGVAALISQAFLQDVRASHISRGSFLMEDFLENTSRAQYSAQAFKELRDTSVIRFSDGIRFSLNCTMAENTPVERCKEMTCILTWNNRGSSASARYVYVLSPKF
jgi:prepilin-type N-terminal cleavage/methylation domain-containing protein